MTKIPPDERETITKYNDAEDEADIYTHSKALQRHIENKLGVRPYLKQGMASTYKVPKSWLRYPQKPSEKRREASRKALEARGGIITSRIPALVG